MAKCLKNKLTGEIRRCSENNLSEKKTIDQMVKFDWVYAPKSEWKATRPKPKKEVVKEEVTDENSTKRGKKSVKS